MRERGVPHRAQAVRRRFLANALTSIFLATAACHGSQTGGPETVHPTGVERDGPLGPGRRGADPANGDPAAGTPWARYC